MLIFLIGLPGSGKTTLGKQLAKKIGYAFSDLDEAIVNIRQASIEDIFTKEGENVFRIYERDCLKAYADTSNTIVSTGGGAPCFYDNMKWMNEHGISIFLNPPVSELANRLYSNNNDHRPMLKGLSKEELMTFLEKRVSARMPYYTQATYTIEKSNPSTQDLIEKIEHLLK